jgi:hypothetical protein
MGSVWLAIPSARPPEEAEKVFKLWREQGYKLALARDFDAPQIADDLPQLVFEGPYPGYAIVVNRLIKDVIAFDPKAEWIVTGGDDTEPDPNHSSEEIAIQCNRHFAGINSAALPSGLRAATFGVMQPTGDRFAGGSIDRIAGSPWIGREFARRTYGGNGPYWHEYRHMFVDEEIMGVAQALGVFWQRPDLIHKHHHFMRESDAINSPAVDKPIPEFLKEANSPEHWRKFKAIFERRRAEGFPGAMELLP